MSKRRPSGDGMVRKKEDGRWEGRIVIGHKENGDSIFRYIYAPTQKELTAKLRQEITAYQGVDLTEDSKLTLSEWLDYAKSRENGLSGGEGEIPEAGNGLCQPNRRTPLGGPLLPENQRETNGTQRLRPYRGGVRRKAGPYDPGDESRNRR